MTLLFSSFRPVNCEMSGCQNYLFRIAQLLNTDTDRLLLKRLRIKLVLKFVLLGGALRDGPKNDCEGDSLSSLSWHPFPVSSRKACVTIQETET